MGLALFTRFGLTAGEAAAPPAAATLARTTSGLIFMDLFEDGDVTDWGVVGNQSRAVTTSSPRYGSGALRTQVTGATVGNWVYRDFTLHSGDFVAQWWARQDAAAGTRFMQFVDDRASAVTAAGTGAGALTLFRNTGQLQAADGGSLVDLAAYAANQWNKLTLEVDVSADTFDAYVNDALEGSDLGLRSGLSGVNSFMVGYTGEHTAADDRNDFDNVVIAKGKTVTVTGLPSGYSVRCTGHDGETATAAESSGTAVVDVLLLDWPLIKVEVLDASGDVVAAVSEFSVGGDVYEFTDGAADPDKEALAVFLSGAAQGRSVGITPHKAAYDATSGKTFFVYLGPGRDLYASSFDHATGAVATPVLVGTYPIDANDDHGGPSMVMDSTGVLHVVWGSHDTTHRYSRSDNARDISSWTTVALTGNGTYPDITVDPDADDLYIIDRKGTHASGHGFGTMRVSTDGGDTFSAAATIVDTSGAPESSEDFYPMGSTWQGGRLHFVWTVARGSGHDGPHLNLYHAAYDPDDGHFYTAGGTDLGTSIDWTDHTSCLVIDSGTDRATVGSITADTNGIYITANVGSLTESYVVTAVWDGSSWETTTTTIRQSNVYAGSVIQANSGTLYLLAAERDISGGDTYTKLNLYSSSDGGQSWSFARTVLDTLQAAGIERLQPLDDGGPFVAIAQAEFEEYVQAARSGTGPSAIGFAAPLFGIKQPW